VLDVAYTQENIDKCWCGKCPVQVKSACAAELYEEAQKMDHLPEPEKLGGLYCATGKAICADLDIVRLCHCPACLVWAENSLASNHYCKFGSAAQTGR
jgi:hypothetical protein